MSKFVLVDHFKLRVLPTVLAVSLALPRKGRTGTPAAARMVHLNHPIRVRPIPRNTSAARDHRHLALPKGCSTLCLPLHTEGGGMEKMLSRDLTVFPPSQWLRDQSFAEERSHICIGFLRGFYGVFCKHHNAFRAGSRSYGKVPHDFSQSKIQIFTVRFSSHTAQTCEHSVTLQPAFMLRCSPTPAFPLSISPGVLRPKNNLQYMTEDTSIEPFRTRIKY